MDVRKLPATRLVAAALVVLTLGFDLNWYLYEILNAGNLVNVTVFDGVISAASLLVAFGLWRAKTQSGAVKLAFLAAFVFFVLWVLVGPSTPFTEFVGLLLLAAGLCSAIAGVFMHLGS